MTTNEQQHTPEPWVCDERGGCIAIYDGEPINCLAIDHTNFIAYWSGFREGDRWNVHAKDSANAARIVACVNACEGMADPAVIIEMLQACAGQVPDMNDAIAARDQTIADLVAVLGASTRKIQAMYKSGHSAPPFDQLSFDRQVGVNEHTIAKAKAVLS